MLDQPLTPLPALVLQLQYPSPPSPEAMYASMSPSGRSSKLTLVVQAKVCVQQPSPACVPGRVGSGGCCGSTSATPVCTWWEDPLSLQQGDGPRVQQEGLCRSRAVGMVQRNKVCHLAGVEVGKCLAAYQ